MDNIVPSADLRNKYGKMSKLCKETKSPLYITVNGRGDTVLMNIAQFNQMAAELELLKALAESDEDIRQGREEPMQETFDSIRAQLNQRGHR